MNIQQIKEIPVTDLLEKEGISPTRTKIDEQWYRSPFREEKDASFKVCISKNVWYDFGLGKGGNSWTLAKLLCGVDDAKRAIQYVERLYGETQPRKTFSFDKHQEKNDAGNKAYDEVCEEDITDERLIAYLAERGLDLERCRPYIRQITYRLKSNGKYYRAIGFKNIRGGYELRNKYHKGNMAPKTISLIRRGKPQNIFGGLVPSRCILFEGFMDFLSYIELGSSISDSDVIVLNSVINIDKAIEHLNNYEIIECYLDNDPAGDECLEKVKGSVDDVIQVIDGMAYYIGAKDLNDVLRKEQGCVSSSLNSNHKEGK